MSIMVIFMVGWFEDHSNIKHSFVHVIGCDIISDKLFSIFVNFNHRRGHGQLKTLLTRKSDRFNKLLLTVMNVLEKKVYI